MIRLRIALLVLCGTALGAGATEYSGTISDATCAGKG
jgi:hypothetical protein